MSTLTSNSKGNLNKDHSSSSVLSNARQRYMRRKHKKYRKYKKRRNSCSNYSNTSLMSQQSIVNPFQSSWFWQNYYKAMEWQGQHLIAYWKSQYLAIEHENKLLHNYIRNLSVQSMPITFDTNNVISHTQYQQYPIKTSLEEQEDDSDTDVEEVYNNESDEDLEFEVTEEMLEFFEQSMRHKLELKKQREEEEEKQTDEKDDEDNATVHLRKQFGKQRTEEMKMLYGTASPMILGMETAMQLSFDRNCDLKQPRLWPNIPLKL